MHRQCALVHPCVHVHATFSVLFQLGLVWMHPNLKNLACDSLFQSQASMKSPPNGFLSGNFWPKIFDLKNRKCTNHLETEGRPHFPTPLRAYWNLLLTSPSHSPTPFMHTNHVIILFTCVCAIVFTSWIQFHMAHLSSFFSPHEANLCLAILNCITNEVGFLSAN